MGPGRFARCGTMIASVDATEGAELALANDLEADLYNGCLLKSGTECTRPVRNCMKYS